MITHTSGAVQEQVSLEELSLACTNRAATYGLLARLYRTEVDEGLLEELCAMRFPASTGNEKTDSGYLSLATYLCNVWENSLEELAVDYTKTFLGSGVDTYAAAHPFESVYTSEKRLMMQDARDEVLAIYRAYGMDKTANWTESEDHIALELEFMQMLALRCANELREENDEQAESLLRAQANFLKDHAIGWIPFFAKDMRKHADTLFYQGLADLTEGFIQLDSEFLDELVR